MALNFTNHGFRLFLRESFTMPKICLTKKVLVLVILVITNVLVIGYFLLASKGKAPELKINQGSPKPNESPSKHFFDRLKEIQKKNSKGIPIFEMNEFRNKSNEKLPKIKDLVQRPLEKVVQSHHRSREKFNDHGKKKNAINRKGNLTNQSLQIAKINPEPAYESPRLKSLLPRLSHLSNVDVNRNASAPVYLCINQHAGLGNRLYIYASSYGLARDKGMVLVITNGMDKLEATFNVKGTYKTDPKLCPDKKLIPESACCKLSKNLLSIPNNKTVRIRGYLQSYRYFEKYRKELTLALTFREVVLNEAKAKLQRLLSKKYVGETRNSLNNRTLVGIHIRRGDYTTAKSKLFGYRMATKEYIFKAQDYMKRNYSNVTFIVCTNGLDWTTQLFRYHSDVIIAPIGRAEVDLALLTLMNHTIITVGTYGFWAAWLNPQNGTVIYYKDFVGNGSRLSRGFAKPNTDTYYPYWIGL